MSDTVRVLILSDEYESPWWYVIHHPNPQYAAEVFKNYYHRDDVYDLPKELVEKYEAAWKMREEVDLELVRIVQEKEGKVERKFPGLPPV